MTTGSKGSAGRREMAGEVAEAIGGRAYTSGSPYTAKTWKAVLVPLGWFLIVPVVFLFLFALASTIVQRYPVPRL